MARSPVRPRSILLFERLYGAGLAVAALGDALGWPNLVARLGTLGMRPPVVAFSVALGLAIPLLLLWLVARRGSAVARGLAVILAALGVLGYGYALVRGQGLVGAIGLFDPLRLLLQVAALACTYRPDARAWFWPDEGDFAQ